MQKYRLLAANGILLLAAAGSAWGRHTESTILAPTGFLQELRLQFRGWSTSDIELSKVERDMLEPDATLVRRFKSDKGEMIELAVIAGHQKKTVHTPGFCLAGGGWEMLSQEQCTLALPTGEVPAAQMLIGKDGARMLATYFFTDGEQSTRNLLQFQWTQIQHRIRGKLPMGALVRIMTPVRRDPAKTQKLVAEFASAALPPVLGRIQKARVEVQ